MRTARGLILLVAGIVLYMALLGRCNQYKPNELNKENGLKIYEDKERNVVCYRVTGFEGLSCIRISNSDKLQEQMLEEIYK